MLNICLTLQKSHNKDKVLQEINTLVGYYLNTSLNEAWSLAKAERQPGLLLEDY